MLKSITGGDKTVMDLCNVEHVTNCEELPILNSNNIIDKMPSVASANNVVDGGEEVEEAPSPDTNNKERSVIVNDFDLLSQ